MTEHYSGSDAARGCGLLLVLGAFLLLVILVVTVWAASRGFA